MAYVNYVKECITFMEFASDERLSASEQSLWHTLFHLMNQRANGSDWPEGFISIPNARVLLYMNVKEDTLIDARNKLKQRGLIDYIKGDRNKRAPQYRMHYFHAELSTGYAQNGESYPEKSGNDRGNDRGNHPNLNVNLYRNPKPSVYTPDDDGEAEERAREALRQAVAVFIRREFGRDATVAESNRVAMAASVLGMNREMVEEAIKTAGTNGAKSPALYAVRLLNEWHADYIFNARDLDEDRALRDMYNGKLPGVGFVGYDEIEKARERRRMAAEGM